MSNERQSTAKAMITKVIPTPVAAMLPQPSIVLSPSVSVLNLIIVVTQVAFGLVANSLALLSDAAHNLSDVLSLVLAFAGAVLARRPPSTRFTYGLRKASILAALANAALLLIAIGGITVEALQRLARSRTDRDRES